MASGKTAAVVVGVVLAAVVSMIFMTPLVDAVTDSTGTQTVENESATAAVDEYVGLSGYQLVDGTVTVEAYNDSSDSWEATTEGTDYEVNYEPGEVQALSGSTLIDDGDELQVTYDYAASDGLTTTVAGFVPMMVVVLIFVVVAQRTMDIL